MKKYLHGRRYMRARASVQIGRENKRARKFKRLLKKMDWIFQIQKVTLRAFDKISEMSDGLGQAFTNVAAELEKRVDGNDR